MHRRDERRRHNTAAPRKLMPMSRQPTLVHRLAYSSDVAAGQLAVFQGASEAPISELIRVERATRKNSQLAAARRVALKMGRRPRCSSVTYRFRYAPSSRLRRPILDATTSSLYARLYTRLRLRGTTLEFLKSKTGCR